MAERNTSKVINDLAGAARFAGPNATEDQKRALVDEAFIQAIAPKLKREGASDEDIDAVRTAAMLKIGPPTTPPTKFSQLPISQQREMESASQQNFAGLSIPPPTLSTPGIEVHQSRVPLMPTPNILNMPSLAATPVAPIQRPTGTVGAAQAFPRNQKVLISKAKEVLDKAQAGFQNDINSLETQKQLEIQQFNQSVQPLLQQMQLGDVVAANEYNKQLMNFYGQLDNKYAQQKQQLQQKYEQAAVTDITAFENKLNANLSGVQPAAPKKAPTYTVPAEITNQLLGAQGYNMGLGGLQQLSKSTNKKIGGVNSIVAGLNAMQGVTTPSSATQDQAPVDYGQQLASSEAALSKMKTDVLNLSSPFMKAAYQTAVQSQGADSPMAKKFLMESAQKIGTAEVLARTEQQVDKLKALTEAEKQFGIGSPEYIQAKKSLDATNGLLAVAVEKQKAKATTGKGAVTGEVYNADDVLSKATEDEQARFAQIAALSPNLASDYISLLGEKQKLAKYKLTDPTVATLPLGGIDVMQTASNAVDRMGNWISFFANETDAVSNIAEWMQETTSTAITSSEKEADLGIEILQAIENVGRGFVGTFADTGVMLTDLARGILLPVMSDEQAKASFNAIQGMRSFTAGINTPVGEGFWTTEVPLAVGQILSFIAGGAGAGGVGSALFKSGSVMGRSWLLGASGTMGVGVSSEAGLRDYVNWGKQQGIDTFTDEDFLSKYRLVQFAQGAVGLTEMIPFAKFGGGALMKRIMGKPSFVKDMLQGFLSEGSQEALSEYLFDVTAKELYDYAREYEVENYLKAFLIGGTPGAPLHALNEAAIRRAEQIAKTSNNPQEVAQATQAIVLLRDAQRQADSIDPEVAARLIEEQLMSERGIIGLLPQYTETRKPIVSTTNILPSSGAVFEMGSGQPEPPTNPRMGGASVVMDQPNIPPQQIPLTNEERAALEQRAFDEQELAKLTAELESLGDIDESDTFQLELEQQLRGKIADIKNRLSSTQTEVESDVEPASVEQFKRLLEKQKREGRLGAKESRKLEDLRSDPDVQKYVNSQYLFTQEASGSASISEFIPQQLTQWVDIARGFEELQSQSLSIGQQGLQEYEARMQEENRRNREIQAKIKALRDASSAAASATIAAKIEGKKPASSAKPKPTGAVVDKKVKAKKLADTAESNVQQLVASAATAPAPVMEQMANEAAKLPPTPQTPQVEPTPSLEQPAPQAQTAPPSEPAAQQVAQPESPQQQQPQAQDTNPVPPPQQQGATEQDQLDFIANATEADMRELVRISSAGSSSQRVKSAAMGKITSLAEAKQSPTPPPSTAKDYTQRAKAKRTKKQADATGSSFFTPRNKASYLIDVLKTMLQTVMPNVKVYQFSSRVDYENEITAMLGPNNPKLQQALRSNGQVDIQNDRILLAPNVGPDTLLHEVGEILWVALDTNEAGKNLKAQLRRLIEQDHPEKVAEARRLYTNPDDDPVKEAIVDYLGTKTVDKQDARLKASVFGKIWRAVKGFFRVIADKLKLTGKVDLNNLTLDDAVSMLADDLLAQKPFITASGDKILKYLSGDPSVRIDDTIFGPNLRSIEKFGTPYAKDTGAARRITNKLFKPKFGITPEVIEMSSRYRGTQESIMRDITQLVGNINKELSRFMKQNKVPKDQAEYFLKLINVLLGADPITKANASNNLIAAFSKDNKIIEAVIDARAYVDNLSRRLIASGQLSQPVVLTMMQNLGHYLHRSYEVFETPDVARRILDALDNPQNYANDPAFLKRATDLATLLSSQDFAVRELTQRVKSMTDRVQELKNDNSTLNKDIASKNAEIQKLSIGLNIQQIKSDPQIRQLQSEVRLLEKKLARNDKELVDLSNQLPIETQALQDAKNNFQDKTVEEQKELVREYFRLYEAASAARLAGFKIDSRSGGAMPKRSMSEAFKSRTLDPNNDLDRELMRLLGVVEDASYNLMNTGRIMAADIGGVEATAAFKRAAMGKYLFEEPTGPFSVKINIQGGPMKALDGLYTSVEIDDAMRAINEGRYQEDQLGTLGKITSAISANLTVFNMKSYIANFLGGLWMQQMAGNIGLSTVKFFDDVLQKTPAKQTLADIKGTYGALKESKGLVFSTFSRTMQGRTLSQVVRKALELGLLGDNVHVARALSTLKDFNELGLEGWRKKYFEGGLSNKAKDTLGAIPRGMSKMFAVGDEFWKIYGFMKEMERMHRQFPNKPNEEIEALAAQRVRATTQSYDLLPQWIKYMRRVPLFNQFMAFQYEVYRTLANNILIARTDIAQGLRRMNRGEAGGREQFVDGMARVEAMVQTYIMGKTSIAVLGLVASSLFNDDDAAPDESAALTLLLPPYYNGNSFTFKIGEDGSYYAYGIPRINPYTNVFEAIELIFGANPVDPQSDADFATNFISLLGNIGGPFIESGAFIDTYRRAADDIDKGDYFGAIAEVGKIGIPAAIRDAYEIYNLAATGQTSRGLGPLQEAAKYGGITAYKFDVKKALSSEIGTQLMYLNTEQNSYYKRPDLFASTKPTEEFIAEVKPIMDNISILLRAGHTLNLSNKDILDALGKFRMPDKHENLDKQMELAIMSGNTLKATQMLYSKWRAKELSRK